MLARSLITLVALLFSGLPLLAAASPPATSAQEEGSLLRYASKIDCDDLVFQEIAQRILERYPDDPFNLDPSGDGIACSRLPARGESPAVPAPVPAPANASIPEAPQPERPRTASADQNDQTANIPTARTERRQPQGEGLRADLSLAVRDVSTFWRRAAGRSGWSYSAPTVRLLKNRTLSTECGPLESGGGPAYCPFDQTIYIDMPVMRAIEPFQDPFLMRVVIAHEWAHHIQFLTGYQKEIFPDSPGEVLSLQMELHADCLAGVWAQHAVEAGEATDADIDNAVALTYVGGDLPGSPLLSPHAHGSGDMRAGAFLLGLNGGTIAGCEEVILQLQ